MIRQFILAAVLACTGLVSGAQAATVGDAASNRPNADGYSYFALAFTSQVFEEGTITNWETYIKTVGNGKMALLVLSQVDSGKFTVKGVDYRTVTQGLNQFTSSIGVSDGDILGVYMETAKVAWSSGGDVVQYSFHNTVRSMPLVNQDIKIQYVTSREYSLNATVTPPAVPLPAAGFLLLGALGGLGLVQRRK
ncbi:MAG: VPLPA-CTERM sorting domain-containing protein [Pseudomonadota bacterium]|nr:VPLPA-CTERM sorting domain-containing protein [Pseudomonadota bacterium]MEC8668484.1 VPLPA-CTERM sorting domain-containing protein [Pseudomonadota bacterium]